MRNGTNTLLHTVYFAILVPHVTFPIVIATVALVTRSYAERSRFRRHARLTRWTPPLWLYCPITGAVVYVYLTLYFPRIGVALKY
jgi:putative membrane protein